MIPQVTAVELLKRIKWRQKQPSAPVPHEFRGWVLPQDYRDVLAWTDGGAGVMGPNETLSLVELWSASELASEQEPVQKYMPGAMNIGGNGGGRLYLYDFRDVEVPQIVAAEGGALGWDCDIRVLGHSLSEALLLLASLPAMLDDPWAIGSPLR